METSFDEVRVFRRTFEPSTDDTNEYPDKKVINNYVYEVEFVYPKTFDAKRVEVNNLGLFELLRSENDNFDFTTHSHAKDGRYVFRPKTIAQLEYALKKTKINSFISDFKIMFYDDSFSANEARGIIKFSSLLSIVNSVYDQHDYDKKLSAMRLSILRDVKLDEQNNISYKRGC